VLFSKTYNGTNMWQPIRESILPAKGVSFSKTPKVELSFISNTPSSGGPVITNVALFATVDKKIDQDNDDKKNDHDQDDKKKSDHDHRAITIMTTRRTFRVPFLIKSAA
ncbi:hypothetical protein HDU98_001440, partial [Podochytrium sp. JEL0797]